MSSSRPTPGFYIIHNPWFDAEYGPNSLYKVGHTGDLARRLQDSCYVTAFPPGSCVYVHTIETATKDDACRIEQGVLFCAQSRRLGDRELVRMPLDRIRALADEVARRLVVKGTVRSPPAQGGSVEYRYARPPAKPSAGDSSRQTLSHQDREKLRPHLIDKAGREEPLTPRSPTSAPDSPTAALDPVSILAKVASKCSLSVPLRHPPIVDRMYQREAIDACVEEMRKEGRTILQMACRCGKTRVAYGVIQRTRADSKASRVMYLVPGLALLRQTVQKFARYGLTMNVLLVGSDRTPLPDLSPLTPVAPQTTDPGQIRAAIAGSESLLVVSTYQSSHLVPDSFDLTIFDECHRVCGSTEPRPYTDVLTGNKRGKRLFMTATPRYDTSLSMKNRSIFGGKAYVYPLRRGIDAGYVNPFELRLISGATMAARIVAAMGHESMDKLLVFCRSIGGAVALQREVAAAAGGGFECLTAHSRMRPCDVEGALMKFCAPGRRSVLFNCRLFQEGVEIPALNGVFFAAPRHSPRDIIQSVCRPLNVVEGKPPSVVFIPVDYDGGLPPEDPANLGRFATVIPFFDALIDEDPLLYEHLLDPQNIAYPIGWVESAARHGDLPKGAGPMRYRPERLLAAARYAVRHGGARRGYERLLRTARIPWAIGYAELDRIVRECGRYPKTTDCYCYGTAKVNFHRFYHYARENYERWRRGESQPLEPYQLRQLEELPGWDPYGIGGPYLWKESLAFLERWLGDHKGVPPMVEINKGGYVGLDATPMERLSGTLTVINQSDGRDRKKKGALVPGSGLTLSPDKQADLDALCARWGLVWRKERHPPPPGAPLGAVGGLVQDSRGRYIGKKTFIQKAFERFKRRWRKVKSAHSARPKPPAGYRHRLEQWGGYLRSLSRWWHRQTAQPPVAAILETIAGYAVSPPDYVDRWFPNYPQKHQHQERLDVWARRKAVVPPRWRGRGKRRKERT